MDTHFPKILFDGGVSSFAKGVKKETRRRRRHQDSVRSRKYLQARNFEDYDEDEFAKEQTPYQDACKDWQDYCAPLWNWINSNVGRPWNEVYSEVCEVVDKRSKTAHRFMVQLNRMVVIHDRLLIERWEAQEFSYGIYFYVDEDGVLKRTDKPLAKTEAWLVQRATNPQIYDALAFAGIPLWLSGHRDGCYKWYWRLSYHRTSNQCPIVQYERHEKDSRSMSDYLLRKVLVREDGLYWGTRTHLAYFRQENKLTRKELKFYYKLHPEARKLITREL